MINENASESYGSILCKFTDLFNITFPKKEVKIKRKNFISPWITKGLVKSSKKKQKLYETFFKKEVVTLTEDVQKTYWKTYEKTLTNSISKQS